VIYAKQKKQTKLKPVPSSGRINVHISSVQTPSYGDNIFLVAKP
jgi:hypothetical protein